MKAIDDTERVASLSEIREAYGLTQDDMAALLRCSRSTIARWESAGDTDIGAVPEKYSRILRRLHDLMKHPLLDERKLALLGRALVGDINSLFVHEERVNYLNFIKPDLRLAHEALLDLIVHAAEGKELALQMLTADPIIRMVKELRKLPAPEVSGE